MKRLNGIELKIVNAAARGGDCPPDLHLELAEVAAAGKLSVMGMYLALLQTPRARERWSYVRRIVLAAMGAAPERGIQVLEMARQQDEWGTVIFSRLDRGPGHAPGFSVKARVMIAGSEVVGCWCYALQARTAERQAAVDLLARIVGEEPPAFPRHPALTQTGELAPPSPKNAISILYEHAAQNNLAPPQFADEKHGPDHIPTIACVCTYNGVEVRREGGSKQEAKLAAAEAIIHALRAEHRSEEARG